MRVTQILCRQHIGRMFTKHWLVSRKKKILDYGSEKVLKDGVPIFKPEDILFEKPEKQQIEVIGTAPLPIKFDHTHPNYHERVLLSYKDNNVLLEGLQQAKLLTNSVELKSGLPDKFKLLDLPQGIGINKKCKDVILNAHLLDAEQEKLPKIKDPNRPAFNFPRVYGVTQKRVNKLLISKLLQIIETISNYDVVRDRYLFNDLKFSFPFEKENDLYQFQLTGDTLISSRRPLSLIENIDAGNEIELPNIFPIRHTISLVEENIYSLENVYPINMKVTKLHNPHTIIAHYINEEVKNIFDEEVTEDQIVARSLMKAFTVAASFAKENFGENVKDLPKPLVLQCVQTNGKFFHFGILQLNTLNLEADSTTRNLWYQTPILQLFDKCCYETGKPVLEGYNREVVKYLHSFYNKV